MSEFIDPTVNQQNEGDSPSQGVLKRLLSRKHAPGVVLPKIRSRISRITKNSDLIRKNRLVLPGQARREQYKIFGTKHQKKQTQAVKVGNKSSTEKVSGHWDQLDMSLSNGAPSDSSRTNVIRPGLGDLGIPSGGQVIAPFNPPTTNNEPSFIERRQERLKNQDTKKTKPIPTKLEKSSRLFSRVEEILPSSREKPATSLQQVYENSGNQQIRSEDKKPSPDQPSTQKQILSEKVDDDRITQTKKSDVVPLPGSIGKDNVVQRQLENEPIIAQKPEQKKLIPEKLPEIDVQKEEAAKQIPQTMQDELKIFASKPSNPKSKIDDKENLEKKVNQKELEKSSSKSTELDKERKIEKHQSIQPPKKIISNGEEKKNLPPGSTRVKETKPISDEIEKKEGTSSLIIKGDVISPSPEKIQREIEQERKPDIPVSSAGLDDEKDFLVEQKLELPVVSKKTINKIEEKNITEKPITRKKTAKFPELQKKATQRSVEEKPELRARKSAERVLKLSRQNISVFSSKPNVGKTKPKNFLPLIKKFDMKSETEKAVISQKRPLIPTPSNVIQRQSEVRSDKLIENDSIIQTRETADEKVPTVVQTTKIRKQPAQIEAKNFIGRKQEEPKTKVRQLKIQQTPLSKKIIGKFKARKNTQSRTEDIRTVQKASFPLMMRSVDKPKQQLILKPSVEGMDAIQINPKQVKTERISEKQPANVKSTNKNTFADRLLVTQPGRVAIQNSLHNTKMGDLSQKDEPDSKKSSSSPLAQIYDQNSKSIGFVKKKKSSTLQQGLKEEKTIKELPKTRTLPEKLDAVRKIGNRLPRSMEELPVVQMKKTTSLEQTFQPEVAVQGPVVQRILAEPTLDETQPSDYQSEVKLDLSKLAKEVYPIIKRWIAVEKERTSGRLF